jgi:hypothetical protein
MILAIAGWTIGFFMGAFIGTTLWLTIEAHYACKED